MARPFNKFTFKPKSVERNRELQEIEAIQTNEIIDATNNQDDSKLPIEMPEESYEITFPSLQEQRATGFMPQIVNDILAKVSNGLKLSDAASMIGFSPKVVSSWNRSNYCNFKYALEKAQVMHKAFHLTKINKADRFWNASAWLLERKYKDEYSKEITITVNHIIVTNVARAVAETLEEVVIDPEILARAKEILRAKLLAIKSDEFPVPVSS